MIPALLASALTLAGSESTEQREAFLSWSAKQAIEIGTTMRSNGRVGGFLDMRVIHTEHSYNYKLRATWMTPEVIRATARTHQLLEGTDDEGTLALVSDAEALGDTVILVEIDPREGSGVIPRDWTALLRPKSDGESAGTVQGAYHPELRSVKALAGTSRRDYAYDVFWLVFPLVRRDGEPLFGEANKEAELVVRIQGKEGRVEWPIPQSIRVRSQEIAAKGRPTP